jgi:hypothetical protein
VSTHSPTPWKRGTDGLIYDANNEYVTDTCGTSLPEGEANQKLIIRAVNSHDELLAACKQMIEAMAADSQTEFEDNVGRATTRMEAAIANVEVVR